VADVVSASPQAAAPVGIAAATAGTAAATAGTAAAAAAGSAAAVRRGVPHPRAAGSHRQ
jgi:hypothetical protein